MRIDGNQPYAWDEINGFCHRVLGLDDSIQVFRGTAHALFEITLGLHLKFSHKRKIIAQFGMGSHMHRTQMELAKLGVRIKETFEEDLAKEKKAVLAYICDLDDGLCGATYDRSEVLSSIEDLGMYRIFISHFGASDFKGVGESLGEHDIHIVSLNQDYAVAILGKNCQLAPLSASVLPWNQTERADLLKALLASGVAIPKDVLEDEGLQDIEPQDVQQNPEAVRKFEAELPDKDWQLWFAADDQSRRFDRAVAILKEHDGEAFVHLFHEKFAADVGPLPELGQAGLIETTSFSRWNNPLWIDKAEKWGRTPEDLRGMVSFSLEFINNPDNFNRVTATLKELHNLSS